ncbi:MAG: neutral/alkaline non-lysosomal ceramidase N-terminal domain-containing protein [Clostridia bacterium]|nr:neutral/alkaline non-lysosomal ceramidase N-terminal domain-containing protein [Clostridia bacterium]
MKKQLYLGTAREIISPEIGGCLYGYCPDWHSESKHDDLTVTAYAFTSGDLKALFISATVCAIKETICEEIFEKISKETGFLKENIILSATHTHSGPCLSGGEIGWGGLDTEYAENIFIPGVVKAAVEAVNNAEPVLMGVASGESKVAVNRRERTMNNTVTLGQSSWGPVNLNMTVLSFKTPEGNVKGNIIAYGCHGTAAGKNKEITRDWSGVMTDTLEQKSGGLTAFFNGTIGDSGPRLSNGKTVGDITYVEELGAVAAKDALRIYDSIDTYKEGSVSFFDGMVSLPLQPRESYEWACEKCEEIKGQEAINLTALTNNHYQEVKKSYEENYVQQQEREIPQKILRIGNVAFVASPFEMFSEIGLRIDHAVPDLTVYLMSNANGTKGYFPTQSELCRGGYEVGYFINCNIQRFTDDADFRYIKATVENLGKLEREGA